MSVTVMVSAVNKVQCIQQSASSTTIKLLWCNNKKSLKGQISKVGKIRVGDTKWCW